MSYVESRGSVIYANSQKRFAIVIERDKKRYVRVNYPRDNGFLPSFGEEVCLKSVSHHSELFLEEQ